MIPTAERTQHTNTLPEQVCTALSKEVPSFGLEVSPKSARPFLKAPSRKGEIVGEKMKSAIVTNRNEKAALEKTTAEKNTVEES